MFPVNSPLFRFVLLALTLTTAMGLRGQYEVSSWRDHYPYDEAREVVLAGDEVIGRTDFALFKIDTTSFEMKRLSKGNPLSQSNPSSMAWDDTRTQLVVGYEDGGVDVLNDAGVINVPDLRIAQRVGSKRINAIQIVDDAAYLCCAFGVVIMDLDRLEIRDTWTLTSSDNPADVRCILEHEDQWLVGTDQGMLTAPLSSQFLANPAEWQPWSEAPDLGGVVELLRFANAWWMATGSPGGNDVVVWKGHSDGIWEVMEGWPEEGDTYGGMSIGAWMLNDTLGRSPGLLVSSWYLALGVNEQGEPATIPHAMPPWVIAEDLVIGDDGNVWVASSRGGVVFWQPDPASGSPSNRANVPEGPPTSSVRRMDCWDDNLWVATGSVDASWTPLFRQEGLFGYSANRWTEPILPESQNEFEGIQDILDLSIDPTNPNHVVFASYEEGLIEVLDGEVIRVLNDQNSSLALSPVAGTPRASVSGLDFDRSGHLWFTNPKVGTCLHVMLPDGTTRAMDLGSDGQNLLLGDVRVTSDGYVWVTIPKGGGILVYDPAGTPANVNDDEWVILRAEVGRGGLPSNDVFCIEEDLDNEIWVGTAKGPAIFYQSSLVFEPEVDASQILISQDGNLQYLLETELVQSIIIDAGNRKWIGTQGSGVFVVSADGLSTDHHFTTENSPLPSNDILDIAMDYGSGEVYIGTSKGLISYRGEASNWDSEMSNFRVMPNPVRADHSGPIVFDGLAYGSSIHLTDATGQRIAVLESNGGRAVWDGIMENGAPAPYGVYIALATNSDGSQGAKTKLAIIR